MKTLIIDNYDSFTFNLYQLIAEVNCEEPLVVRNDQIGWPELQQLACDNIVLSPGPGRPDSEADFGICRDALLAADVPVLGVCLGHQGLGAVYGGRVIHAPAPMHGRLSRVYHRGSGLFAGIPQGFAAVRYHSLIVAGQLPGCLERTAWTEDGIIMGLRHRTLPRWGVQFHPESICTEHGRTLLVNFRELTRAWVRPRPGPRSWPGVTLSPAGLAPGLGRQPTGYTARWRRLPRAYDAEQTFVGLFGDEPVAFWLDSSRVEPGLARFSFMGAAGGPLGQVVHYRMRPRELTVTDRMGTRISNETIFAYLDRELRRRACPADGLPFDFNGGFVGYFGYELKGDCGAAPGHPAPLPDAQFILADRLLAFDHQEQATYLVALEAPGAPPVQSWFDQVERQLAALPPLAPPPRGIHPDPIMFRASRSYATYLEDVRQAQQAITDGESYEVCLTNQIWTQTRLEPLALYRSLRSVNPAPYAAFLRLGESAVLCSSPERFLRIDRDGVVESKPIKGTAPRSADPSADRARSEALRTSVKNRAENLMIVDLLRNDLGIVCEVGSVSVPRLMHVETYQTVHQLVSTVRGRLRPHLSAIDCIRSAFPGGSMTGAPKLRTMEIIDQLEREARGVYSGAIGFLGLCGAADLNIVIRTIVVTPRGMSIGVGGAVVALSDPEDEFDEALLKGHALAQAILLTATGDEQIDVAALLREQIKGHDWLGSHAGASCAVGRTR